MYINTSMKSTWCCDESILFWLYLSYKVFPQETVSCDIDVSSCSNLFLLVTSVKIVNLSIESLFVNT